MSWWEKLGIGKNKKDLEKAGLTEKDIQMMGDAPVEQIQRELLEREDSPIWKEEETQGNYAYPLPQLENVLIVGREIAMREPAVKEERLHEVGGFLVEDSPESHCEAFNQSIDFLVPDGTPVLAVADGTIIEVVITNHQWGPSQEFAGFQNRITIQHDNGEYSQYIHLAKGSADEIDIAGVGRVYRRVKKGDQIALVGKTGWTDRDHLHFMVFRMLTKEEIDAQGVEDPYTWKSLKPKFEQTSPEPNQKTGGDQETRKEKDQNDFRDAVAYFFHIALDPRSRQDYLGIHQAEEKMLLLEQKLPRSVSDQIFEEEKKKSAGLPASMFVSDKAFERLEDSWNRCQFKAVDNYETMRKEYLSAMGEFLGDWGKSNQYSRYFNAKFIVAIKEIEGEESYIGATAYQIEQDESGKKSIEILWQQAQNDYPGTGLGMLREILKIGSSEGCSIIKLVTPKVPRGLGNLHFVYVQDSSERNRFHYEAQLD